MTLENEKRARLLEFLRGHEFSDDMEARHVEADRLLVDTLGDPEVAEAWEEASSKFWYA